MKENIILEQLGVIINGYDKYNSRSLFRINSFNDNDTIIDVIQFFSSGYQSDYFLVKSNLISPVEDF